MKDVIVLYKNLGETLRECVERFKTAHLEYVGEPMTYAGRLDPMAEGLLLVLSGEKILEKETYTSLSKTYEFEMVWGMETDTVDLLGIVNGEKKKIPDQKVVQEMLKKSVGKFMQKYPAYSSRTVFGADDDGKQVRKSLIEWSRAGRIDHVEIPSHDVELTSVEYISRRTISATDMLQHIEEKIALVRGDFRQIKIVERWREFFAKHSETEYVIDRVQIDVSGGFYVRQFVSDVARELDAVATTYHITRSCIGDFHSPTDLHYIECSGSMKEERIL